MTRKRNNLVCFFFFKQKTAYEMRISDWSSDVALPICTEAILELEAPQVRDGIIYFNPPGRMQTKKRRSTVPVAPSLRPWLAGASGKIIRYQTPLAKSSWADPAVPEYHERP